MHGAWPPPTHADHCSHVAKERCLYTQVILAQFINALMQNKELLCRLAVVQILRKMQATHLFSSISTSMRASKLSFVLSKQPLPLFRTLLSSMLIVKHMAMHVLHQEHVSRWSILLSGANKEKEHLTVYVVLSWFDQISPYMVVGKDLNIITSTYNVCICAMNELNYIYNNQKRSLIERIKVYIWGGLMNGSYIYNVYRSLFAFPVTASIPGRTEETIPVNEKWKHRGCWCLGGGTEAIRHEATYLALLGRSSSRSLHCAKVGNDQSWSIVAKYRIQKFKVHKLMAAAEQLSADLFSLMQLPIASILVQS